jgi:hypothetical protein
MLLLDCLPHWGREGIALITGEVYFEFFCSVENLAPNKLYEPVKVRENALT